VNATSNSQGPSFLTFLAGLVLVLVVTHLPAGAMQSLLDAFQTSSALLGSLLSALLSAVLHLALFPFGL
jgi:Ca2+/H+ antiporter